jgi:hypothetical protein
MGAKFVIVGTMEESQKYYVYRLRALNIETTQVVANVILNVKNDKYIKSIINEKTEIDPRLIIALENIAFGLGSYLDGDWKGGLTVTGGYVAAIGLIIWELNLKYEDDLAGIIGPIGVGIGGLSLLYGIVRPYIHERNPQVGYIADNFNIALIPTADKTMAVNLSYKIKF